MWAKVKWATLCQFHLCNCNPDSQEAVLTIHRWGNCRKPLPDHSCPAALRWLASGGCGSYFKHSPPSKPTHSHQCQRKKDSFTSRLSSTFQTSWDGSHRLNDTQKPAGKGIWVSQPPSPPALKGRECTEMPRLHLANHSFSNFPNHAEITDLLLHIFPFSLSLWFYIFYCNFSRVLAGQWIISCGHSRSPEIHVQKQPDQAWLGLPTGLLKLFPQIERPQQRWLWANFLSVPPPNTQRFFFFFLVGGNVNEDLTYNHNAFKT